MWQDAVKIDRLWDNSPRDLFLIAGLAGEMTGVLLPYILESAKKRNKSILVFTWLHPRFEGRLRDSRSFSLMEKIAGIVPFTFIQNNNQIVPWDIRISISSLYQTPDETIIKKIEHFITGANEEPVLFESDET